MTGRTRILALSIVALLLAFAGLAIVPQAIFSAYLLTGIAEIPGQYRTEAIIQAIGVIAGALAPIALALWMFSRAGKLARQERNAAVIPIQTGDSPDPGVGK